MNNLLSQKELDDILKEHQVWLETDGKKGKRADFRHKVSENLDFSNKDLSYAFLNGAMFYECNFKNTNLHFAEANCAHFLYCNFVSANLDTIDLNETIFLKANLDSARIDSYYKSHKKEAHEFVIIYSRVKKHTSGAYWKYLSHLKDMQEEDKKYSPFLSYYI